jgi:GT2 family glycosyltransferase
MEGRANSAGVLTPWGTFSIGVPTGEQPFQVSGLTITNLAVRRTALSRVGGFDEDLIWAHIDGLLFLRMQSQGLDMYMVPGMSVLHHVNPTGSTRSAFWLSRDQAVFFSKISRLNRVPRSRLVLAKIAAAGFWLASPRGSRAGRLFDALRGYSAGVDYLRSHPPTAKMSPRSTSSLSNDAEVGTEAKNGWAFHEQ